MDTYHIYDEGGMWRYSSWLQDTDDEDFNWLYEALRRGTYDMRVNFKIILF